MRVRKNDKILGKSWEMAIVRLRKRSGNWEMAIVRECKDVALLKVKWGNSCSEGT